MTGGDEGARQVPPSFGGAGRQQWPDPQADQQPPVWHMPPQDAFTGQVPGQDDEGPDRFPVVGQTSALRGRPGGPGFDVPRGAVAGLSDQRSAWQQAQGLWLDSGISGEAPDDQALGALSMPLSAPTYAPEAEDAEAQAQAQAGQGTRFPYPDLPPLQPARSRTGTSSATRRPLAMRNVLRVGVPVIVIVGVGVGALMMLTGKTHLVVAPRADTGKPPSIAAATFAGYPGAQSRGAFGSLSAAAENGNTIVVAGDLSGIFRVSTDGGASWQPAVLRAADSTQPSASLIAGGNGGWLALGRHAIWTSQDGHKWTLASTSGIPGKVLAVARTDSGFIATGSTGSGGTIWTTQDGVTWRQHTAAQLGLAPRGQRVLAITAVAAQGGRTMIAGTVEKAHGGIHSAVWRSAGGGWAPVAVPAGRGTAPVITGLAASSSGFAVLRPGTEGARRGDLVVYFSRNAQAWRLAATLTAGSGLRTGQLSGDASGFTVSSTAGNGQLLGYRSDRLAARWSATGPLGQATADTAFSLIALPGGGTLAAGATLPTAEGQQPLLALASVGRVRMITVPPTAGSLRLTVNALAVGGSGTQIAAGASGGYPAIWRNGADGSWTLARGSTPGTFSRPGLQKLTGIAHGPAGWVAVGGVVAGVKQHPVVVTSADGVTWQAADAQHAFASSGTYTSGVAAGKQGYVIVGRQVTGHRTFAAVWWSSGLGGWTRGYNGNLDGRLSSSEMLAVTALPRGFIAVGQWRGAGAWTSADGRHWTPVSLPVPAGSKSAVLRQVAANGNHVVATGDAVTAAGKIPFAVVSADGGATWTEVTLKAPGGTGTVTALTSAGRGFVAAGVTGQPGRSYAIMWTSANGLTWSAGQPVTGSPAVITALTATGQTVTGIAFPPAQQPQTPELLTLPAP